MEKIKKYLPYITFLISFFVYLFTMAPSVIQIDTGELAAVQSLAGIAHPTGYPLFTMLGKVFSLIPLPFSGIYKLNLLAALWCAAGTGVFTLLMLYIFNNINYFNPPLPEEKSSKKKQKQAAVNSAKVKEHKFNDIVVVLSVLSSALILSFSKTYWFQSTSVEVYSLHILLINIILYALVKAFAEDRKSGNATGKHWYWFAAALALGFTNHMTTLLIIPGAAYLFFVSRGLNKDSIKLILLMLTVFVPVLIVIYLYLPVRAGSDPLLNWGNPVDLERIFRHISGKQYQVWLFSSTDAAKRQLIYFFESLPSEFSVNLFLSAAGIIAVVLVSRRLFVFTLICFLSTVFYSINYDIVDIDSYFLLAFISLSVFAAFGWAKITDILKFKNFGYAVPAFIMLLFTAVQAYGNFKSVNQSGNYVFEDYTKALLSSTDQNSIIFGYQWDYFISPAYYFQFVEGFRKDAAIVDKELLRRSWYYNQLNTVYPRLLDELEKETSQFLEALKPFERDENYNPQILEQRYRSIMTGLLSTNLDESTFYVAPEIFENEMQRGEFALPQGYSLVPDLFLFKVVKQNSGYIPAADPDFSIRPAPETNRYISFIRNIVAAMLARRALYEMQFNKTERAKVYIDKVKTDFPEYRLPEGLANIFN